MEGRLVFLFALFLPISLFASETLLVFLLLACLISCGENKKYFVKTFPKILIYGFFVFFISFAIGIPFGIDPLRSIQGVGFIWLFLLLPVLFIFFENSDIRRRSLIGLGIGQVAAALYSIPQYFWAWDVIHPSSIVFTGKFYRASGFYNHWLTYGNSVMACAVLFGFMMFLNYKKIKYIFIFFFASLMGLYLSLSSAPLIGAFAAAVLGGAYLFFFERVSLPGDSDFSLPSKKVFAAIGFFFILCFALFFYFDPSFHLKIINFFQRLIIRRDIWIVAWKVFKTHSVFGVGIDNYPEAISSHLIPGLSENFLGQASTDAHSLYLQTLAQSGIIGMFGFLTFWISVFYSFRYRRQEGRWDKISFAAYLGLIALLISGLANVNFYDSENTLMYLFLISLSLTGVCKNHFLAETG